MKTLVVMSFDLPTPEDLVGVIEHIDPPNVPYFNREIRIVVGTDVADVIKFLDEE